MNKYQSELSLKKIDNSCLNAIRETEEDIGTDDTIELLTHALPFISERKNMINLALQENDMDRAALYAHKTLGSIRLYGTKKLEKLLTQLKSHQVGNDDFQEFQAELASEFDDVSFAVKKWLSLNYKSPQVISL